MAHSSFYIISFTPLFSLPLKFFGCICYVYILGPDFDELDARTTKCVFLGYSQIQKEYRCYSPILRQYFTSVNVTFLESTPYFSAIASRSDCLLVTLLRSTSYPEYLILLSFKVIASTISRSLTSILMFLAGTCSYALQFHRQSSNPVAPSGPESLPIALHKSTRS
jgi:hypothetical protein